eukprot:4989970-Prymnesium_polylepis.1
MCGGTHVAPAKRKLLCKRKKGLRAPRKPDFTAPAAEQFGCSREQPVGQEQRMRVCAGNDWCPLPVSRNVVWQRRGEETELLGRPTGQMECKRVGLH